MTYHSLVVYFLLLSVSCTTSKEIATHHNIVHCMSNHLRQTPFTNTSNFVYTQDSSLYTTLLRSAQHNPRWLNSTSEKPISIVTPYTEAEIRAAILCSRENGLQIRIRSGGHDYEGLSYLCKTAFIIIDLRNLRSISIDMDDKTGPTAWVQSGATLGELYYSIAQKSGTHGFPAGLGPSVGIGGHFSGGGFGTMVRKYGLAADNVVDAYLVDVNGRVLNREAMGEDVFWAIRGGGGASYGVIVSWKIKLVRVPPKVTIFDVHKKLDEHNTKLVHHWQHLADKLKEELFIRIVIQDVSENNKTSVQASFNSLFLGEINDLIPYMNKSFPQLGLKAEDCIEMTWIESVLYFAGYPIGQSADVLLGNNTDLYMSYFKAKSDFVTEPIPISGLEGIWERFLEEELVFMIMDPYGGKMSRISDSELPFPHRKGNLYNIQYLVKWEVNGVRASSRHVHWIRMLYKYMKPYVSHSPRAAYLNYRDLDLGTNPQANTSYSEAKVWGKKYFKGNFKRLAQVKSKVDPGNFFRNEQSIPLLSYT